MEEKMTGVHAGPARNGANVLMIVHAYYPEDPRVRREAEALSQAGYSVDIVSLRNSQEKGEEEVNGIRVYRLPITRHRGSGKLVYLAEYVGFFLASLYKAAKLHRIRGYGLVQVHNLPDFLVFAALLVKGAHTKVLLDLHDLMPDLYQAKFRLKKGSFALKAILAIEGWSIKFADHVITSSKPFKDRLCQRGVDPSKVDVVLNSPDPAIFMAPSEDKEGIRDRRLFELVYHGTLAERYGLDVAVRALSMVLKEIPHARLLVYGRGEKLGELKDLAVELGIAPSINFLDYIDIEKIPAAIGQADLGIVPLKLNEHTEMALPTKLLEYISLGIPVVASRTPVAQEMFSEEAVSFFEPGDANELADKVLRLYRHPDEMRSLRTNGLKEFASYSWPAQRERYLNVVKEMMGEP